MKILAATILIENVKLLTFVSIFFMPLSFCMVSWFWFQNMSLSTWEYNEHSQEINTPQFSLEYQRWGFQSSITGNCYHGCRTVDIAHSFQSWQLHQVFTSTASKMCYLCNLYENGGFRRCLGKKSLHSWKILGSKRDQTQAVGLEISTILAFTEHLVR